MDADPLISQSMDVGEDATAIRLVIKRAPDRVEQVGGVGAGGKVRPTQVLLVDHINQMTPIANCCKLQQDLLYKYR